MSIQSEGVSPAVISAVQHVVRAGGPRALVVDDLSVMDLANLAWLGNPEYLRSVARKLAQVTSGDVEYLVIRAPTGEPVAAGAIDYTKYQGAGNLSRLATHPQLQSMGLGTCLIAEAEQRIRRRRLHWAMLSVEDNNLRARALYERLGYVACGHEPAAWQYEDDQGMLSLYETEVTVLRKRL